MSPSELATALHAICQEIVERMDDRGTAAEVERFSGLCLAAENLSAQLVAVDWDALTEPKP